ncbi:MAG: DNA cytosine methyltransferase [Chthoniobacterales bacterium]
MADTFSDLAAPPSSIRFIDLFCGIGGFHFALRNALLNTPLNAKCVYASDIDITCQNSYEANFGLRPKGDITRIKASEIPDHDLLLAGFPCQPFSIIGERKGFDDTRGTLFFDIARILKHKQPAAFVLENVKMLKGHDGGRTLKVILRTLEDLGYRTDFAVLNALDFGLPQKRERIWIVGNRFNRPNILPSKGVPMMPLEKILERNVEPKHFASNYIVKKRKQAHPPTRQATIWHENKSGNISAYPYSCALRAGASYNYLLVNGERRLTPREMLRLQGFPESFKIVCSDSQTRKQAGNSLPVNVAQAVLYDLLISLGYLKATRKVKHQSTTILLEKDPVYHEKAQTT